MKNALLTFLAASVAFLLMPHAAEAHHGWLEFDPNHEVTFDGTVTDFHFTNPHCVVEFDVKDEKGQVHKWQGEFSNPAQLSRKGWTRTSRQKCCAYCAASKCRDFYSANRCRGTR